MSPIGNHQAIEDKKTDYSKLPVLPLIPIPLLFDAKKRIQELRSYLDPKCPDCEPENQHINIKALIKLYEEGKIDGTKEVCIKDGKIVSKEETYKGPSPSAIEPAGGMGYQYTEKYAYGHGSVGTTMHEASIDFSIKYFQRVYYFFLYL